MKIISDKQLSFYDEKFDTIEYETGAHSYRDYKLEDHRITLDNGIVIHVGCEHGKNVTISMVIDKLKELFRCQ